MDPRTPTAVLDQIANHTFERTAGEEINTDGLGLVRNGAASELVRRGVREAGKQHSLPNRDLAGRVR